MAYDHMIQKAVAAEQEGDAEVTMSILQQVTITDVSSLRLYANSRRVVGDGTMRTRFMVRVCYVKPGCPRLYALYCLRFQDVQAPPRIQLVHPEPRRGLQIGTLIRHTASGLVHCALDVNRQPREHEYVRRWAPYWPGEDIEYTPAVAGKTLRSVGFEGDTGVVFKFDQRHDVCVVVPGVDTGVAPKWLGVVWLPTGGLLMWTVALRSVSGSRLLVGCVLSDDGEHLHVARWTISCAQAEDDVFVSRGVLYVEPEGGGSRWAAELMLYQQHSHWTEWAMTWVCPLDMK